MGSRYRIRTAVKPLIIDAYNPTERYEESLVIAADAPGTHTLSLINTSERNPASQGNLISIQQIEVLPSQPAEQSAC